MEVSEYGVYNFFRQESTLILIIHSVFDNFFFSVKFKFTSQVIVKDTARLIFPLNNYGNFKKYYQDFH